MLKRLFFLLIAVATTVSVQAQTIDEILANYFENTGGLENWENLKTTKVSGKMHMGGMDFPGTIIAAKPNKQYMTFSVQGKELVQAYDGETAWTINPFMGATEAQKMPEAEAKEFTEEEFDSPFINYKDKGHTVELVGTAEVEGAETYEVKLTKKNGKVEYHYFETENAVPIMTKKVIESGQMKGQEAETYFSDYQEVDGMYFPFFIETKIAGQSFNKITVVSVELNPEVDEAMFVYPKKETAPAVDDK
ncbi:MAG: hypothetical protein DHS20C18_42500 [Saprospiraceae bacterium]|nr:MAG: hypothetical protein DHS20C18_42500 [Saprospiraceae bacterium]